ncbi:MULTISPECIES: hypothetical protein [unclassified Exiguobacterium]|uniref:hypothetical protein n=1 Tax=unclassified Exiguobacterium TaxID=2644629 RepID=UPI000B58E9A1|nr:MULTISPECIES: hypothetical protein [unclassified Exiguobacterium]ASI34187.1 hypothetical protein A0126_00865 [Exiguobacterium sp. N4-1P]
MKNWMYIPLAALILTGCSQNHDQIESATKKVPITQATSTFTLSPLPVTEGEEKFATLANQQIGAVQLKGTLKATHWLKGVEYLPDKQERVLFSMELEPKKYDTTIRFSQSFSDDLIQFGIDVGDTVLFGDDTFTHLDDYIVRGADFRSKTATATPYNLLMVYHLSKNKEMRGFNLNEVTRPADVPLKKGERIFGIVLSNQK